LHDEGEGHRAHEVRAIAGRRNERLLSGHATLCIAPSERPFDAPRGAFGAKYHAFGRVVSKRIVTELIRCHLAERGFRWASRQ